MPRLRLIHWNAQEAAPRILALRAAGFSVQYEQITPDRLRAWAGRPPHAFVIDLTRLPAHGRDVALALRAQKATRGVPLVFVDGDPEKVARIRQLLPDAGFASWTAIRGALKRALARPVPDPVVPASRLAGYSGTPLPQKLGIKAGSTVALVGAPGDFEATLGSLPEGVVIRRGARGARDLTIWFIRTRRELQRCVAKMPAVIGRGGLWIAWPKRASGVPTDVSEPLVRKAGLAHGLVDYKICAIDRIWSGLKFALRARAR
jgi:hypothetical protein